MLREGSCSSQVTGCLQEASECTKGISWYEPSMRCVQEDGEDPAGAVLQTPDTAGPHPSSCGPIFEELFAMLYGPPSGKSTHTSEVSCWCFATYPLCIQSFRQNLPHPLPLHNKVPKSKYAVADHRLPSEKEKRCLRRATSLILIAPA